MECNRDDALKAKEMAERKFLENDFVGAKKFALKAQTLCPSLDGIGHLLTTLDVYLASEETVCGEKNFYAILCSDASADEETLKRQYKKMALQLHPDKNQSLGAEGAFKLILEAWTTLSDKSARMAYDQKIVDKGSQNKVYQPENDNSVFVNANTAAWEANAPRHNNITPNAGTTLWTCCSHCNMEYKHHGMYINLRLFCPNCRRSFVAKEIARPKTEFPWPFNN